MVDYYGFADLFIYPYPEAVHMTIFKEIIDNTIFDGVWAELQSRFDDAQEYMDTYMSIYKKLKESPPDENTTGMTIVFKTEPDPWDDEDNGEYVRVCGMVPGDDEGYAIGVKSPQQIMGFFVSDDTVASYSSAVITALCIVEITYYSSAASAAWGSGLDTYAGGLYAAQSCIEGDDGSLSIDALREQLGVKPKKDEDDRFSFFQF